MKVLVGSENPVKIEAVRETFSKYFDNVEVIGRNVSSGVPSQPLNSETYEGARNRAENLREIDAAENTGADFFVGIEGGISSIYSKWFSYGCMCIIDRKGRTGFGTSPHFELPAGIMEKILAGMELGSVMDEITGTTNTKRKSGAIGFLTNGVMNRKELYVNGLVTALCPFLHEELYFRE